MRKTFVFLSLLIFLPLTAQIRINMGEDSPMRKLQIAEMMQDDKAIKDATMQINTNTGRLQKLDKDEQERIAILENVPEPSISSKLISISFIKVICSGQ